MYQHGRLRLGQVCEACLVDRLLAVADGPGGALGLLVHGTVHGQRGVAQRVVVVAADRSRLVDGELEEVVAVGLLPLDHGEDAERQPFLVLGGLGLLAGVGDGDGLLGVFLLGADRVAVDVDGIPFVDDVGAVVVVDRLGGIAAVAGARRPGGGPPDGCRGGPGSRTPDARISAPPGAVEAVVMAEVAAYEVSLIDERLTVDGDGGVPASDGARPGDRPESTRPRRVARQAAGSPDPADPADAADASNAARSSRSAN